MSVPAVHDALAMPIRVARIAKGVVIAALAGLAIVNLVWAIDGIAFDDVESYWSAALRVRNGEQLYPAFSDIDIPEVYRYSPWFAWLWVPLTYLPRTMATAIWTLMLAIAGTYIALRLVRLRAWLVLLLFGPIILDSVLGANVQVLMVALLLCGTERRWGPVVIAAAASLKGVPLLLALVYAGRREWLRLAATGVLGLAFVAPFLLYDLSHYTTDPGNYTLLWGTPYYVPSALASIAATLLLARTRYAWLVAALAIILITPRIWGYHLTYLLVGMAGLESQQDAKPPLPAPGTGGERQRRIWPGRAAG
jgi:hypothetical protein